MTLTAGDTLPEARFIELGESGPAPVESGALFGGRKVVLFAVPGAYTGTCTTKHVPSFIRAADGLREKGVDEIVCVSVNDPFVMAAWGKDTGADAAGIRMLGDADGAFTKAIGMEFSRVESGLIGRSKRYAMLVEDGAVRVLNVEESTGQCDISSGEAMLAGM